VLQKQTQLDVSKARELSAVNALKKMQMSMASDRKEFGDFEHDRHHSHRASHTSLPRTGDVDDDLDLDEDEDEEEEDEGTPMTEQEKKELGLYDVTEEELLKGFELDSDYDADDAYDYDEPPTPKQPSGLEIPEIDVEAVHALHISEMEEEEKEQEEAEAEEAAHAEAEDKAARIEYLMAHLPPDFDASDPEYAGACVCVKCKDSIFGVATY
jgi:hypothetical protein